MRRLRFLLTLVSLAASLGAGSARAQDGTREVDPDMPDKSRLDAADVRRWSKVGEAELNCPVEEFRALARKVAAGTTDVRALRAYARLEQRLAPFDFDLPRDYLVKAVRQKRELGAKTVSALPDPGCWVPLGPRNIPGRMTALVLHPSDGRTAWAGAADGGLWKTSDLGQSWTPLTDQEPTLAVGALAVDRNDPDTIYIGTGEGNYSGDSLSGLGVLKSSDGGFSWSHIPVSTLTRTYFHQLEIDPTDSSSIWAALTAGLYHSVDAGMTWAVAGGGLPTEDVTAILVSPKPGSRVIIAALGAGGSPNSGLWRSTDAGASWSLVPSVPAGGNNGRAALAQSRSNPDRMYAAIASSATSRVQSMWRSDDEGATWTAITIAGGTGFCAQQCWYNIALAVDAAQPDVVYAAGLDNWLSEDAGANWSRISAWNVGSTAPSYAHADQHWAVSPAADEIWVANDGGVSRSTERGASWSLIGRTLETAQYYHITTGPDDDAHALAGSQDNGTQKFSGSYSWNEVIGGDGFFTAMSWEEPGTWYGSLYFVRMFRSRNYGNGWTEIGQDISAADTKPFLTRFFLDRSNPRTVYACTNRLWRSTDEGASFSDASAGTTFTTRYLTAVETCRDDGNTIYVGTRDGRMWVSRDGGGSWNERSTGLPAGRTLSSVSVHPSDPLTAYVSVAGYNPGQHIYKTTDAGQTWSDISATLPDITFSQVMILEDLPTTVLAASDVGVFWSTDAGATWGVLGSDLPTVAVDWLSYSKLTGTLRAGTHGRGAWQLVLPNTCALFPEFDGLTSLTTVDVGGSCRPELSWSAGRSNCALAPGLVYNVYRSTDPGFTPGPANLLQSGLAVTTWQDASASFEVPYYYLVRAEDGQSGFPGPSNGGREDRNANVRYIEIGDPVATGAFADDGGDSSVWLASAGWSVSDTTNATPAGRYAYGSVPFGAPAYVADVCATLETPDMVLGAGAVLRYQASFNLEDQWDGVAVEISTDGGANWSDLPPTGGYPRDMGQTSGNACGWPRTKRVFSGPAGNAGLTGFTAYDSDLAAWAGQTVRIRWLFSSDPGLEFEGFYLDDVSIAPASSLPGACQACVPGAADLVSNSLRMGRDGSGRIRSHWTALEASGRWNLHATPDRTAIPTLHGDPGSEIASAALKVLDEPSPGSYPYGYYQLYRADNCTGASLP